ncbi:aldo/keto reductase [Lysobacter korlensis]|uniref:Aldo/keto reductase n=1 Tax=Lysobacter korlensis TaxID=553636 RepID=A0ABV6S257_9GAMM
MTIPELQLNDGKTLPAIGLGTYGLRGPEGIESISNGIASGYRLLDTALNYRNEREVGEAVRGSGLDRSELLVTTKLPGRSHGYEETLASFEESRTNLGLDYVDLYLIHWPLPRVGKYLDSWKAMIELRDRGDIRSIGVSNFTPRLLQELLDETGVAPAVNQVELHPYFPQAELRAFHAQHGIVTESWSPLARKRDVAGEPVVQEIAAAHSVTPMQTVLRWHVQVGALPIPKSANAERQRTNLDVFRFSLTEDEVAAISALEDDRLWGADPETHEEF